MTQLNPAVAARIKQQWSEVEEYVQKPRHKTSHQLVGILPLAKSDAVLGQLFPFVGISGLSFSRCCDYPFYVDISFTANSSEFVVWASRGKGSWHERDEIGFGDATEAVRIATSYLPAGYPPAILGNSKDLNDSFANDPFTILLKERASLRCAK